MSSFTGIGRDPGCSLLAAVVAVVPLEQVGIHPRRAGIALIIGAAERYCPRRRRAHAPSVLEERALPLGIVPRLNHHVGDDHKRPSIAHRSPKPIRETNTPVRSASTTITTRIAATYQLHKESDSISLEDAISDRGVMPSASGFQKFESPSPPALRAVPGSSSLSNIASRDFDGQEKAIVAGPGERPSPEDRMVKPGQAVEEQHPQHGADGRVEDHASQS